MTRLRPAVAALATLVASACANEAPTIEEPAVAVRQSALSTCKTAGATWTNTPFAPQSGLFTVTYTVKPLAKPIDSVVGLSRGAQTDYPGFAVLTRFNTSGNIDARNGNAYAAASTIPYSANVTYTFRLVVDIAHQRYDAFVKPASGAEVAVGLGYAFRSEQAGIAQMDSWGTVAKTGSAQACAIDVVLPQAVTVNPVADAYVRDGSFASTNFGSEATLDVKTSTTGYNRWVYLKFDITRFTNVTGARLRLEGRVSSTPAASIPTTVYAVSSTSWGETTITWNNKPPLGAVQGSFNVINAVNKWYDVDVTAYVKAEKAAGHNLVTFALKNPSSTTEWLTFLPRTTGYWYDTMAPELSIATTDAPIKPAVMHDTIDGFLGTPASGALYTIPVVLIRFLPTQDGTSADPRRTVGLPGAPTTLTQVRDILTTYDRQVKFALEEGSRFRGFSNPSAPPAIGYRIIDVITLYEEIPEGPQITPGSDDRAGSGRRLPDYTQILTRIDAKNYVENLGVKEFWMWSYQGPHLEVSESRMSSPTTADVSNGWYLENGVLPVFNKTYLVYNYNDGFPAVNAVHNHGHQQEAELRFTDQNQDLNLDLYRSFIGLDPNFGFIQGRSGDTHHPPNASADYDYDNSSVVMSDIMDWKPQGGAQTAVTNTTWKSRTYAWPNGEVPPQPEMFWHIFWRQAFPGRGNVIQDASGQYMTNWWRLVGDWDGAYAAGFGLHAPTPAGP